MFRFFIVQEVEELLLIFCLFVYFILFIYYLFINVFTSPSLEGIPKVWLLAQSGLLGSGLSLSTQPLNPNKSKLFCWSVRIIGFGV